MSRYQDEQDTEAAAEFQAELAQQADYDRALSEIDADAPGFIPLDYDPCAKELFTSYDQHGFLDSEWQR